MPAYREDDTAAHLAQPTSSFSHTFPTTPTLLIPPVRETQKFPLPPYAGLPSLSTSPTNEHILRTLHNCATPPNKVNEWSYSRRRQFQEILPFLYLGPSSAARDIPALKEYGITLLLVIRNTATAQARLMGGEKVAAQLGIEARSVDVAGHQELIAAVPQAMTIITEHIRATYREGEDVKAEKWDRKAWGGKRVSTGKVLVFCESGNERSACVVAAYLIGMYQMGVVEVVQFMQSRRFCTAFDDEAKNLLVSWGGIVRAMRGVGAEEALVRLLGNGSVGESGSGGGKRAREEMADDDVDLEMEDVDDHERFVDREFTVPFESEDEAGEGRVLGVKQ